MGGTSEHVLQPCLTMETSRGLSRLPRVSPGLQRHQAHLTPVFLPGACGQAGDTALEGDGPASHACAN